MTNISRSKVVALRTSAGLFVLTVGCASAFVGAGASALAPATTATNAMSGEPQAPLLAPRGPSCIIGLNCGCIRGNCPGDHAPHHHPAPANDHPNGTPAGPAFGGSGG